MLLHNLPQLRSRLVHPLVLIFVATVGVLATIRESEAIPAFARKNKADCAMCHFPVIPRLNNFGQRFKRAGYRTQTEFNKDQDLTNVSDMLAGRIKGQFAYDNARGRIERSEFRFPDVSLFYAGALSRNFSAWIHAFANNSTSVDFHGHIQGVWGSPDQFVSVRVGQMHMLQQEGVGGFDRPTSININPVHSVALTRSNATTGGAAYTFDLRQKGIELAYIRGPGKLAVMISNGLNQTGSGQANIGDIDSQKDYMVLYEHLLDALASGFTLFYDHGTTHGTVTPAGTTGAPASVSNELNFSRLGFNVSKVFSLADFGFFELQGGYVRSHDNNPAAPPPLVDPLNVTSHAFYIESQQNHTGRKITFYERYSRIELNGSPQNGTRVDYTAGLVKPLQTRVRLSGDYTYTLNPFGGTGQQLLFELQINF